MSKTPGEESRMTLICKIDKQIVDSFVDQARVTDASEMGGYLLGSFGFKGSDTVYYFYDYVQCPNAAGDIENEYTPDEKCIREVNELLKRKNYDAFTGVHTHQSDSTFSEQDIFASYTEFWMPFRGRLGFVPNFLITGNKGYIVSYSPVRHEIWYEHPGGALVAESYSLREREPTYFEEIRRYKSGTSSKIGRDYIDFLITYGIHATGVKVSDLEEALPEEPPYEPAEIYGNILDEITAELRDLRNKEKWEMAHALNIVLKNRGTYPSKAVLDAFKYLEEKGYSERKMDYLKEQYFWGV